MIKDTHFKDNKLLKSYNMQKIIIIKINPGLIILQICKITLLVHTQPIGLLQISCKTTLLGFDCTAQLSLSPFPGLKQKLDTHKKTLILGKALALRNVSC